MIKRSSNSLWVLSGDSLLDFLAAFKASWKKKKRPTNEEIEKLKAQALRKILLDLSSVAANRFIKRCSLNIPK